MRCVNCGYEACKNRLACAEASRLDIEQRILTAARLVRLGCTFDLNDEINGHTALTAVAGTLLAKWLPTKETK